MKKRSVRHGRPGDHCCTTDGVKSASWALVLLIFAGCGPSWQPKQAQFVVTGCPAVAVGVPEEWRWQAEPAPVLTRGPAGTWDSVDVLNPSVVEWNGRFYNLYSGFDGRTWRTGLAVS